MKIVAPLLTCYCAVLLLSLAGCGGEPDANTELEKAAQALGQADAAQASPAPAQPVPTTAPATAVYQSPGQQMNQAVTLYKNGEYENAVMQLHHLRERATLTPQQNMALQDAMAAVMTDMYRRAADGDVRAQQAVKQYEASKNAQRR